MEYYMRTKYILHVTKTLLKKKKIASNWKMLLKVISVVVLTKASIVNIHFKSS